MEGPISFWGYKEQESNLILPEHDDDDPASYSIQKEALYFQVQRTTHQRLEQVELYLHIYICIHDK